jgi:hypothetical protein
VPLAKKTTKLLNGIFQSFKESDFRFGSVNLLRFLAEGLCLQREFGQALFVLCKLIALPLHT